MRDTAILAVAFERFFVLDEVADEQVWRSVAVVVEPDGGRVQARRFESGLRGYIGERAVAVVPVQDIAPIGSDEQVGSSVEIVIAGGHANAEIPAAHTGAFRD